MFNKYFTLLFLLLLLIIVHSIGYSSAIINGEDVGEAKYIPKRKKVIVTGQDKYPFMAHLSLSGRLENNSNQKKSFSCAGVIISEKAVLTAAHCFDDFIETPSVEVQVGIVHLLLEQHIGQFRKMKYFSLHEGYTKECYYFQGKTIACLSDMALVFVDRQFTFGRNVQTANLSRTKSGPPNNEEGWILGWGNPMNRMLQKARMRVIASNECQIAFNAIFIGDDVFCVLSDYRTQGSCSGDSGGPFVMKGLVYGILSFGYSFTLAGIEVCNNDKPSIYTNIADYTDWIEEQLLLSSRKSHTKINRHSDNKESNYIPPLEIPK